MNLDKQQENPSLRREGTSIQRCEEKIAPSRGREGGSKKGGEEGFGSSFICFCPWACLM